MHRERLAWGLTVAFAAMSGALLVAGLLGNPLGLVVAAVFAAVAALVWYQASGRLASRVYRRVERRAAVDGGRGGFGAGPREEWTGPHRRRGRGQRRQPEGAGRGEAGRETIGGRRPVGATGDGRLTAREAYAVLDLEPGADADAVRDAYRERIKAVHPDAPEGDEAAFRRVRSAYERLAD